MTKTANPFYTLLVRKTCGNCSTRILYRPTLPSNVMIEECDTEIMRLTIIAGIVRVVTSFDIGVVDDDGASSAVLRDDIIGLNSRLVSCLMSRSLRLLWQPLLLWLVCDPIPRS